MTGMKTDVDHDEVMALALAGVERISAVVSAMETLSPDEMRCLHRMICDAAKKHGVS